MADVLFPIRRDRIGNVIAADVETALRLGLNADGTARADANASAEADERAHVALLEAQRCAPDANASLPEQPKVYRGGDVMVGDTPVPFNEIGRRLAFCVSLAEGQCGIDAFDRKPLQERLDAILAAAADRRIDPGLYKIVHALAHAPCPRPGQNLSGNRTESARDPGNAPSGNRTKVTR